AAGRKGGSGASRTVRAIKRAACEGKRPKSREETPKEGGGNARRYRTATTCHRSAQEASPLFGRITSKSFRMQEKWAARSESGPRLERKRTRKAAAAAKRYRVAMT